MTLIKKYKPFIIAGAIIITVYSVGILWAHFAGILAITENAEISELKVCSQDDLYQPVVSIAQDTEIFYACGKVEGTTSTSVAFYLLDESQNRSLFLKATRLWPGIFFIPLSPTDGPTIKSIREGTYQIQVLRNQMIIAKAPFIVEQ